MFRSPGEKLGCLADLALLSRWLKQGSDEERRAGSVGRGVKVGVEAIMQSEGGVLLYCGCNTESLEHCEGSDLNNWQKITPATYCLEI